MLPPAFGQLWPETVELIRRHRPLLVPVAAAFLFLPQLLFNWRVGDATPDQLFTAGRAGGDAVALLFLVLMSLVGQLVIVRIAVDDGTGDDTLGAALQRAVQRVLPALAASLLQGMAVFAGLLLFILPGIWLFSRLCLATPLVATSVPDPIDALKRSWQLTDGHSLRIIGMLGVLLLALLLVTIGIAGLGAAVGVVSTIAAGQTESGWGIGRWLFELLAAGASAAIGLAYIAFLGRLLVALGGRSRSVG
ncbi:MAG: hypothetical protein ACK4Z0_00910 [Sphingomonadaceae bacterium]